MNQMEQTTKSLGDKLDKYEEDYQKLKTLMEINNDKTDFLQNDKYKNFMHKLERKNELRREIVDKQDRVHQLKEKLSNLQRIYEVYNNFYNKITLALFILTSV